MMATDRLDAMMARSEVDIADTPKLVEPIHKWIPTSDQLSGTYAGKQSTYAHEFENSMQFDDAIACADWINGRRGYSSLFVPEKYCINADEIEAQNAAA